MGRAFVYPAIVIACLGATSSVDAQVAESYNLPWTTIDGGGVSFSTGGVFRLGVTMGQPDAGSLSGGIYSLQGGFWSVIPIVRTPLGECDIALGSNPALNPRCDRFDLIAILEDRKYIIPGRDTDFNNDTHENDLDLFLFSKEWYQSP